MSTTHLNRSILISLLLLLIASSRTAGANRTMTTSRTNFRYRTHRLVPRVVHIPYYVTPCDSFSRPYARSMCLELQRIHRSTVKQPFVSPPPPPPPEIDPRYGVDKRLVPSGPNPLHN
ncbi:CLAVATA3/ESR (CLE)-related protein 9-like [Raphanus sativus]|uniref:CLAVATA3/ESR (CLE)-related protein 9-like n=1 Tax=Raphanus sativus TaxID=3726 RepID=A0A6J0KQ48_RAPSA|nr:CLAVATA3/ESR (CLE)-related protein 9-like [Raphanus sativus]